MAEASRLSTTAGALREARDALANALMAARPDEVEASEATIAARAADFQDAARAAAVSRDALPPEQARAVAAALQRCRRLGGAVSLLAAGPTPALHSPHGYSPVGQPLPYGGEGALLTARG